MNKRQLSIGIFINSLNGGGVTWAMYRLAQGLAKQGTKVLFITGSNSGELSSRIGEEFEVVDLQAPSTFLGFYGLFCFLKKGQIDILISNILQGNLAAVLARLLSQSSVPLVLVDHALLSNELSLCSEPKRFVEKILVRLFYPLADRIVAVSAVAAEDTRKTARVSRNKIEVIYNAVIPYDFDEQILRKNLHPWLQEKDTPVVLAVGRLSREKGVIDLVKAFAIVRKRMKAKLLIAGEGGLRMDVQKLIGALGLDSCVSLSGFQSHVYSWIHNADLFVQPSLSEAFGNTIVEALACGTRVVSTQSGGPAEILENGKYGRLVPPADPEALAEAILDSLSKKNDSGPLENRGRSFSIDTAVGQYMRLFQSLLEIK